MKSTAGGDRRNGLACQLERALTREARQRGGEFCSLAGRILMGGKSLLSMRVQN